MRRAVIGAVAFALALALYVARTPNAPPSAPPPASEASSVERAISARANGVEVEGEGILVSVLRDDNRGSRHQRLLVRLASGRTVLIAHNIDVAPRIGGVRPGDRIAFKGEYVWNDRGGVVHWTHRDPRGSHEPGWVKRGGETFQ